MPSTRSLQALQPLLERLSLLRVNQEALDRVIRLVNFANQIQEVHIPEDTKPMVSPVEDQCLYMRDDQVEKTQVHETTKNAEKMVEDYFVTPNKHKHYSKL